MKKQKVIMSGFCLMILKHTSILVLTVCALLFSTGVSPALACPRGEAFIPLPADLSGTLHGADYKIRVPANWNGTLLVYAHGTGSGFVEVVPPTVPEEQLLARGYALAGSYYLDEGDTRTHELTHYFKRKVGDPQRIIVWGLSWGGDVSLSLIEKYPDTYDGAIPVSAEAGGRPNYADFLLRYDLAYAAVFGWPADVWGPIEDLRDDLAGNEGTLIAPIFQWEQADPNLPGYNIPQWEFVRLVMKESPMTWWEPEPSLWGMTGLEFLGWAATAMRSNMERIAGGPVSQNIGDVYSLTDEEKAYLLTLGVNADGLLAYMNEHTNITARKSARVRLGHFLTPSGDLHRPALIMQGIFDPIVPPSNQSVYRAKVKAAGNIGKLVQVYINTWHSDFTADHYLAALAAMEHWLDTGKRPKDSFFPESLGFDNSYVPPPWPY